MRRLFALFVLPALLTGCNTGTEDEVQGYGGGEYRYNALPESGNRPCS